MAKPRSFRDDIQAVDVDMQTVAGILAAAKENEKPKTVEVKVETKTEPSGESRAAAELSTPQKASSPRSKKSRGDQLPRADSTPNKPRKNVTTRLTIETDELLTEAALRQELKRAYPNTRQDITEEALLLWFREHGYDRRKTAISRQLSSSPGEVSDSSGNDDKEEGEDEAD